MKLACHNMSPKKKIVLVLLTALIVGLLAALYQSRFAFHALGTSGRLKVESVSLINLIATPERYHGKWVRVEGICNFEFEGNALYLSRDDRRHGFTKNAIWASWDTLGAEPYDPRFMFKFDGRHVLVEGYFDMRDHGHMGLFSGAITNVTRLMTE